MNGWINKMWYTHAMKYYSVIKKNDILIHATTRVNLKNIMLSERSQTQKVWYCSIYVKYPEQVTPQREDTVNGSGPWIKGNGSK